MLNEEERPVSVILPVYNDSETIKQSIESILCQDYQLIELVIVNDGSTDTTEEILDRYDDRDQVKIVSHRENLGLPAALNTGLEHCTSELIARQDADDRSKPKRIGEQMHYMVRNPEVDVVATGADVINDEGTTIDRLSPPENPSYHLSRGSPIVHGSVMFRKQAVRSVGGYDPFFTYSQDYELWIRLNRAGYTIRGLDDRLYELRRQETLPNYEKQIMISDFLTLARIRECEKESMKTLYTNHGINDVLMQLTRQERAKYHQRLSRIQIRRGMNEAATKSVLRSIRIYPFSKYNAIYFGLVCLPNKISNKILDLYTTV